jgi:hypothetical protein
MVNTQRTQQKTSMLGSRASRANTLNIKLCAARSCLRPIMFCPQRAQMCAARVGRQHNYRLQLLCVLFLLPVLVLAVVSVICT